MALGPLGLLDNSLAPSGVLTNLGHIEAFDLSSPREQVALKHGAHIGPDEVDTALRELKRFLSLRLLVPKPKYDVFVPSLKVDLVWHEFILHTRLYREFCGRCVGGFIDHEPSTSRALGRAAVAGEIAYYTKQQIQAFYGATPPFIWGIPTACDNIAACAEPVRPPLPIGASYPPPA
jgi:hypothetical protein